jgi:hypothetical protein
MPVPYITGEAGGFGTWYLAIMWQNKHLLRALRVLNFVLVPNPESRFQRETMNLLTPTEKLREIPEKARNDMSTVNNMYLSPLYRKSRVRGLSDKHICRI